MSCPDHLAKVLVPATFLAVLLLASSPKAAANAAGASSTSVAQTDKQHLLEAYGKLPLTFEANTGQTSNEVKFLSRGSGYTLFLTQSGDAVLVLQGSRGKEKTEQLLAEPPAVLRMRLVGASVNREVAGFDPLPGRANYFVGNDPAQWRTNVPTYARVMFHDAYRGIGLAYYGIPQQLEYDFIVAPHADPRAISLTFEGADRFSLASNGELVLIIHNREVRFRKPVVYQEVAGQKREISGRYTLKSNRQVGFQIAAYNPDRPLVIDPVLSYSTYLGGSLSDVANGIAVDSDGNAYVTGSAGSPDFPTTSGVFQSTAPSQTGAQNAFVAKLTPDGSALLYSTYLGGSAHGGCTQISPCTNGDQGTAIAVDSRGNAYVTGMTTSSDFPTTSGAFQPVLQGMQNAFASELNSDGAALLYSTFLGGSKTDAGSGVAVDSQNNIDLTGTACSSDFPTTPLAFQPSFQGNPGGGGISGGAATCNAFMSQLNPALPGPPGLVYSTYLGGSGGDQAYGIAVDSQSNAYVTGRTFSTNFPTTSSSFQPSYQGGVGTGNAFVSKLNPAEVGSASLLYSTYLGGRGGDNANAIAVDSQSSAYVTGLTCSANFPVTPQAFQAAYRDFCPAFVTKFSPDGSALVYSSFLSGTVGVSSNGADDEGLGIALDSLGNAYVTGTTTETDFPTTPDAIQSQRPATRCPFVTVFTADGSALIYSTYFGGSGGDTPHGIAVDNAGNVYVAGWTTSKDFPTTPGAFQTTQHAASGINSFIAQFSGFPSAGGSGTTPSSPTPPVLPLPLPPLPPLPLPPKPPLPWPW